MSSATKAPGAEGPGDWVLVPRLLSERMRKTLHGSVVIRCHLDKREASIMNDQAWWEAVLAAVPVPAPGANDAAELARLAELSDFATPGAWYTVDTPWGDGTWLVAGNPDPHAGTMVCDCQDVNETRPEDGPDAADDAAFIAASVNYVRKLIRSGQLVASTPGQKGAGEEKTGACLTGYAEFTPISVRSSTGAPASPSGHSRAEPSGLGASPECPSRGLAAPYGIIDPDYARVFTIARCLAWQEGYALLMHGSFTRDLDLLAVPWGETPCEPKHLISRIQEAAGLRSATAEPSRKPHGRLTWTLLFDVFGDPRFVDIGVIASAPGPGASGDLASAIAAEIMGLGWAPPEFTGDEDEEAEEHIRRHGQVQSIVEAALRTLHAAGEVR